MKIGPENERIETKRCDGDDKKHDGYDAKYSILLAGENRNQARILHANGYDSDPQKIFSVFARRQTLPKGW